MFYILYLYTDQEKKRSRETSGNVDGVGDTESIGSNTQDTNPKDMVPSKTSTDKETVFINFHF